MTAPFVPADVWESLVGHGLSEADATRHVLRALQNQPEAVRQQYLQDIDPGKWAAVGLGAADMMSFGLGDQVARAVQNVPVIGAGEGSAQMTQQQAQAQHPTAHLVGEGLGLVGPAGVEYGLAKAGLLAPTAIGAAVRGIKSTVGRAAAKTALNAAVGAGYAGAQAAGRTEGGLKPRLAAAGRAAPYGAAAGVVLPWAAASVGAAGSKVLGPVLKRMAGAAPAEATAARGLLSPQVQAALEERIARPLGGPLEDLAAAQADRAAGKITDQEFNTAMEMASQRVNQTRPMGLLAPEVEMPAFTRGPQAMSVEAMQGRAGLPTRAAQQEAAQIQSRLAQLGKGKTVPYYPRGGKAEQALPPPGVESPPVIGPASPEMVIRQTPYATLTQLLQDPNTSARIRQAVLQELQRRGIVGAGLLGAQP